MKKPNVLHIPLWYPNRDDEQLGIFIKKQIEATSNHCNNIVLSIIGSPNISSELSSVNRNNDIITIQLLYVSKGNRFKRFKNYLKALQKGLHLLTNENIYPDIIHCHVAGRNLRIAEKYFPNTPILLSEHWSGYLDGRFDKMPLLKKKKLITRINNCAEIITVSEHLKNAILSLGIKTNISIIDNVIEVNDSVLKVQNDVFTFLVVSDLVDQTKNISGVINAFSEHINDYKSKLIIIGDGKDRESLVQLTKKLRLTNFIEFLGRLPQEEVLDYYPKADCVIINSNFETYSMVTAEAILSGVPVIATKCKGPEQFVNKENGILIDINNQEQLKLSMEKMHLDVQNYKSIGNSISSTLSKDSVGEKIISIYKKHIPN